MSDLTSQPPLRLFYSYAHKDEALRQRLEIHLTGLQRQKVIVGWHDRAIDAGQEWAPEIKRQLDEADIILLLVSADFLASDYCWGVEVQHALKRHNEGTACVIPIILKPADLTGAPFMHLQCLPKDKKPVITWPIEDEAWTDVTQGIRRAATKLQEHRITPAAVVPAPPVSVPAPNSQSPTYSQSSASSGNPAAQVVSDSGECVLLDNSCFSSQEVEEAGTKIRMSIESQNTEEEAFLRSLSGRTRGESRIGYAFGNDGGIAEIESVVQRQAGGKRIWTVSLTRRNTEQTLVSEMNLNIGRRTYSAHDIATLRARRILLAEPAVAAAPFGTDMLDSTLESMVRGSLGSIQIKESILPVLYRNLKGRPTEIFLRTARLFAIYQLRAASVVEYIQDLVLGPVVAGQMEVTFRGQRHRIYTNVPPALIEVKGVCRLE